MTRAPTLTRYGRPRRNLRSEPMALDPVDLLLDRIVRGGKWPPQCEAKTWRALEAWRAFLDADREGLKKVADWRTSEREYKVDPLPGRIADAWADHLFGEELVVTIPVPEPEPEPGEVEEPELKPGEPKPPPVRPEPAPDQARLDELVEENDLTDEVRAAERECVAEGEVWWRIYVDTDVADVPLIEWHSRRSVAPLYIGRRLMACALISELEGPGLTDKSKSARWRHFEIHVDGAVEHVLFRGTKDKIGSTQPLDAHPETEELALVLGDGRAGGARWDHGLPMLMGRITNKRGRDPRLGVSEFDAIKDYLLDLNEAVTIAAENARLTAKKRVVVPPNSGALRPRTGPLVDNGEGQLVPAAGAEFAAGEDVLIANPTDAELGREGSPFKVLEYSYDAEALIAHKRDIVESALTRIGLTPVWVGVRTGEGEGQAASGTHLRLRMIPTDKAGRGKGRSWDGELPVILNRAARVDALAEVDGGLGTPWADLETLPTVERAAPLPRDEVEEATIESTLLAAGARSVWQSVRNQWPEWDDREVDAEVDRIRADKKAATPAIPSLFGAPAGDGPPGDEQPPPVGEPDDGE